MAINIDLGGKIRELRLQRGMTQEVLASALGLSAQSVSKWENGATMPDVQLLPELSVLFGVSIDELFSISGEMRFDRIDSLLSLKRDPGAREYDDAEAFLSEKAREGKYMGRALTTLAALHNHRALSSNRKAACCAKRALELEPEKKANHSLLCAASGGVVWDWCLTNHHAQIAYYQDFVAAHPDYHPGYLWLMEMLLADYRLEEAGRTLERMRRVRQTYHAPLYLGHIAAMRGDMAQAESCWARMTDEYPDTWLSWSARAEAYARYGFYDKALECYRQSGAVRNPPRVVDDELCIAHILEIKGDWAGAAEQYERIIDIMKSDWNRDEGDWVDGYKLRIAELRGRVT